MTMTEKSCPHASCDEGTRCILEEIHCNFITECLDGRDEEVCDNKIPDIPPPPKDRIVYRGLSGWVITLVIIPLSMIVGAIVHLKLPVIMSRVRGSTHSYREFNEFGENA